MTFLLLIRHSSLHLAISSKRSLSLAHLRHPPLFFSFILFQFLSFVYSIYLLLLLLLLETTIHLPSSSSSSCYTRAPTSITQRAPRTKRKRERERERGRYLRASVYKYREMPSTTSIAAYSSEWGRGEESRSSVIWWMDGLWGCTVASYPVDEITNYRRRHRHRSSSRMWEY